MESELIETLMEQFAQIIQIVAPLALTLRVSTMGC